MSKNKKLKRVLLVFIVVLSIAIYAPLISKAQVQLEIKLPDIPGQAPGAGLAQYIRYLFIFGLGLITILALTQMIIGGITYILAAGNATKVEDAKDMIFQALFGVGILLISYLLLRTINPDLVNLTNPNLTPNQFQGSNINTDIFRETPSSLSGTSCNPKDFPPPNFACVNGKWMKLKTNA